MYNRWIKIVDEYPKSKKDVLVLINGTGRIFISKLIDDSEYGLVWMDFEDYYRVSTSDCWMDLPEKPKP